MIVGVGCDIVEHKVSQELNWETDTSVLQRIFSTNEIELYLLKKDLKFLCGRFAAKEALLKCLGTGMQDGIRLNDIQILQSSGGGPKIELLGEIKEIVDNAYNISRWHISITHSTNYSLAFVTAEAKTLSV